MPENSRQQKWFCLGKWDSSTAKKGLSSYINHKGNCLQAEFLSRTRKHFLKTFSSALCIGLSYYTDILLKRWVLNSKYFRQKIQSGMKHHDHPDFTGDTTCSFNLSHQLKLFLNLTPSFSNTKIHHVINAKNPLISRTTKLAKLKEVICLKQSAE